MKTIVDYASKVKEQHALNKTLAPVETDLTDASRAYAIGEQFIYDGDLFKAKTPIAQHDALVLNTNYEAANNLTAEIEALTNKLNNEIVTRSALGAKNILPFDLAEIKALNTNGTWAGNVYTYRGVAFTVNSDGTISATGTATGGNASIKLFAASSNYEMLGKEVILTGCPSNGSASTYRIQAYRMASADGSTGTYFDDGAGTDAFTVLNDASGTVGSFAVAVYENATVTNLLFKPMVRLASDPDATYQPYAKTNQELTAENQTLTNEVDTIVNDLSVKNIFDIEKWLTTSGLAYTKNDDTYTTSTGGTSYSSPFSFADKDIDIVISGIITNITSAYARIEVLNANDAVVATLNEGTSSATGKGSKIRLNYSTAGNFSIEKPMIRPASITSDDYAPYAMTNRELTEAVTPVTGTVTPITNTKATLDLTYTVLHKIGHMAILDFVLTVNSADDWTVIGSIDLTPLSIARTIIPAQAAGSDAIKIQLNTSKQIRIAGGTVNKQYEGQLVFLTND